MPAYKPDEKMITFLDSLLGAGMNDIIIINDGSGEEFDPIFEQAKAHPEVTLLVHEVNKGKGAGLKTAFKYLSENRQDIDGAVTCDADGQHDLKSIQDCLKAFVEEPDSVIIGGRDFKKSGIPWTNRAGNNISSVVYRFAIGIKLKDTQTGLRVIPAKWFETFSTIKGDRYEYETSMFISMMNNKIQYREVPITTIYIDDNASSHFNIFKDSFKIYKIVLGYFLKFILSSLTSWVVDIGIFAIAIAVCSAIWNLDSKVSEEASFIAAIFQGKWNLYITTNLIATVASRVISSIVNFIINRKVVFKDCSDLGGTVKRYYLLALCQMLLSFILVDLLTDCVFCVMGFWSVVIKCVVDACLFIFSYGIQRKWVFKNKK